MTSKEAIIKQLKNLEGKPLKQKVEHIATYFWQPILIALVLLIGIGSFVVHLITAKDTVFYVNCINSFAEHDAAQAYLDAFADDAGIDRSEFEVQITVNFSLDQQDLAGAYNTAQAIAAQVTAGTMDVMAGDLDTMLKYCYQEYYQPLNQFMTEQEMEQYQDSLIYVDMALVRYIHENFLEKLPDFPDPTKPEDMEEPVAVALLVAEDSAFRVSCYPYRQSDVLVGMVVNAVNAENAHAFLNYIMESAS